MKTPLRYQLSEYDCGPTSLLNAVSFLFERETIPPVIIRNIMLYCLDTFSTEGISGTEGTSRMAMRFISGWLDDFGKAGLLPVQSSYLAGESVYIGDQSPVNSAVRRGGAAVVRLQLDVEHYVLLTGDNGSEIFLFDPYLWTPDEPAEGFRTDDGHPYAYNRIVPYQTFNREEEACYALGPAGKREAVLLFNTDTMIRQSSCIEYFI